MTANELKKEAIEKAMRDSQKRKREEKLYKPLDDFLKRLKKKIKEEFAPLYVSGFDQLHIIRLGKVSEELYDELDGFNRKNYRELVKHAWGWAGLFVEVKLSEAEAKKSVDEYLKGYDPVTQYVYDKEVDRKRMRLNEAILTAREYQDVERLYKAVKKAADLWYTQSSQYALDLMLTAIRQAFEKGGATHLRWNTQRDDKVCGDCHEYDGKVFPIREYPEPPHYNCRCYPTPANPDGPGDNGLHGEQYL